MSDKGMFDKLQFVALSLNLDFVRQSQRDCVSQPKVAVLGYLGTSIAIGPNPNGVVALVINDET
jgi:hypothetical protein